jgi:uncharacterized protein (TIGR02145 family)
MKNTLLIFFSFFTAQAFAQNATFTDPRDGNQYKTIKIGRQTWMAENIRYKTQEGNYFLYNRDIANLSLHGYLYDWEAAAGACPDGWRLPTTADYLELSQITGGNQVPGKLLLKTGWQPDENASNESGFSAYPGGFRDQTGKFREKGKAAYFWTSEDMPERMGNYQQESPPIVLGKNAGHWINLYHGIHESTAFSVRCMKENQGSGFSQKAPDFSKWDRTFNVHKQITCTEEYDDFYNGLHQYQCQPAKSVNITISIRFVPNNSDLGSGEDAFIIQVKNPAQKVNDTYTVNGSGVTADGKPAFEFEFGGWQPSTLILDEANKKILVDNDTGNRRDVFFYR